MDAATAIKEPHEIPKRDLRFDLERPDMRTWHPAGLHVAHFWNALSIFFPLGETFFIEAVQHYAGRIQDPKLQREVRGFTSQEGIHSREHRRYNRALASAGLPVAQLERIVRWRIDVMRKYAPPIVQLAVTIALEHFTAMMAHVLLTHDDESLGGADPVMAATWRWHAIEETEHKAVAFDVYRAVCGTGPVAYFRRTFILLVTSVVFWLLVFLFHARLVAADGRLTDVRGWGKLFRFLWMKPGVLRRIIRPWFSYFRPSFHPWEHDNSDLVDGWKAAFAATGQAPA